MGHTSESMLCVESWIVGLKGLLGICFECFLNYFYFFKNWCFVEFFKDCCPIIPLDRAK